MGLNPLRSGLGFNLNDLLTLEDGLLVTESLNPLRSGLGFNSTFFLKTAAWPSNSASQSPQIGSWFQSLWGSCTPLSPYSLGLNPLRSGLGFNINNKKNKRSKNVYTSLNPLRSGLGFNKGGQNDRERLRR